MNKTADIAAADIEASPEYQALLVAVAGKPERSMGDAVIPAEPPAWGEARKLANSLLSDPPHLSVLVFLTKAEANVAGYIGMYQAFERMHDNLLSAWDSMIPEADADDPDDPYYERVNYLHELSEDPAFISGLQRIPLVEVRGLGAFSVRDIDIANGQIEGTEEEVARCQEGLIRGAFAEAETETLTETQNAVTGLIALIDKIETLFNERAGAAHGLSLSQLQACLAVCQSRLNDFVVVNTSQTTENDDSMPADTPSKTPGTQHAATAVTTVRPGAALADRDAVCASFDQIIRFYQQYEPTSPVPVLAQRARDMTSKSFFEVLEDLGAGEKGNLPALLGALDGNPLGSVLNDSYQRFLNGEVIAPVTAAEITTESVIVTPAEPEQVEPAGEPDLSDVAQAGNNEQTSEQPPEPPPETPPQQASAEVVATPEEPKSSDVQPQPEQAETTSRIHTRADVIAQLSLIEGYFNQCEPSSPIPLIVAEIRKLLPKSFTDLIAEFNRVLNPITDQTDE